MRSSERPKKRSRDAAEAPQEPAAAPPEADSRGDDEEGKVPGGASELAPARLAAFLAAEKAKGVVYLAHLPDFIKPLKVRHLLERLGAVGRVYLAPEDAAAYHRRVRGGGSKRVCYTEGWAEFLDKRVAKAAALLLNGTPMGGAGAGSRKRGFFTSDIWNIKYLRRFKWHHLAEKAGYEKRVRALELRNELARARRRAERYVGHSEQARKMRARKREPGLGPRQEDAGAGGEDGVVAVDGEAGARATEGPRRRRVAESSRGAGAGAGGAAAREFEQREALPDRQLLR